MRRCKHSGPRPVQAFGVHYQVKEDVRKQRTAKQPSAQRCKLSEPKRVEVFGVHYQVKEDVRKQRTAKQPSGRRLVEASGDHCP